MTLSDTLPIIVGVGQTVDHWDGSDAGSAPSPVSLAAKATERALEDCGVSASQIDSVAVIRSFSDSLPSPFDPFGRPKSFAASVMSAAGLSPTRCIYSPAGGEQPQALVNELSAAIYKGESEMALITGAEAIAALKTALKNKMALDWAADDEAAIEDRGAQTDFITGYEILGGMGLPPQTYAIMEQALRARLGLSKNDYRHYMAQICAGLSQTAARNPYAQFPQARSVEFLRTPSKDNYPICDPHLKWHIAQDAVNQGAALILTSVGKAKALGIDPAKWIYLHGHASVNDKCVSERTDISKSLAIDLVIDRALKSSGVAKDKITHRDIYSCFPIVVHIGAQALGLDPAVDEMSVTGGLPFFGAAGNNYSTHAIASLVEALRADKDAYGLVLANGGFISKQSAGVYSTRPPSAWTPVDNTDLKAQMAAQDSPPLLSEDCEAVIESYTVRYGRKGPDHAFIFARNADGRLMASLPANDIEMMEALAAAEDPVGCRVVIRHEKGKNIVASLDLK